ncbi:MAG: hypothetical protein HZC40_17020 [Chloroflexi bacterium]|nr:hypothetical protein [Chloroflexota bacterium]
MQAKPEGRRTAREQVRSLAKFQMLRLINRRATRANQDHWNARELTHGLHQHEEPTRDPLAEVERHLAPGVDPIANLSEVAFVYGRFTRDLFTGKVRTHNLVWLIVMTLAGIAIFTPFAILAQFTFTSGEIGALVLTLFLTPLALTALALWINVLINFQLPHHA